MMAAGCYDTGPRSSPSSGQHSIACTTTTSTKRARTSRTGTGKRSSSCRGTLLRSVGGLMASLSLVLVMGMCPTLLQLTVLLPTVCHGQEFVDDAELLDPVDPDLEVTDADFARGSEVAEEVAVVLSGPAGSSALDVSSPSSSPVEKFASLDSNMVEVDGEMMDVDTMEESAVVETDGGGDDRGVPQNEDNAEQATDVEVDADEAEAAVVEEPTVAPEPEPEPGPTSNSTPPAPTSAVPATTTPTAATTPLVTTAPTMKPTLGENETAVPTDVPTLPPTTTPMTPVPTTPPTFEPTISMMPTLFPTLSPTDNPTDAPTLFPTQAPTLPAESSITGFYQQDILLTEEEIFTDLQVLIFEDLYQSYTPFYGPGRAFPIRLPSRPRAI